MIRGGGLLLRYASQNSLDESSQKQVPRSGRRERTPYRNSSHTVRAFEVLQSLRKYVQVYSKHINATMLTIHNICYTFSCLEMKSYVISN